MLEKYTFADIPFKNSLATIEKLANVSKPTTIYYRLLKNLGIGTKILKLYFTQNKQSYKNVTLCCDCFNISNKDSVFFPEVLSKDMSLVQRQMEFT